MCELIHCCHILLNKKACACSRLSFFSRSFYKSSSIHRHYYEKFSPGFHSFFFSFFLRVLCLSVHKLYMLAFPSQFFLLALPPFPIFSLSTSSQRLLFLFFFLSCFFFLLHQLRGSILCHETEQTIAKEEEEKKERKAVAVVAIMIVRIYIDRSLLLM